MSPKRGEAILRVFSFFIVNFCNSQSVQNPGKILFSTILAVLLAATAMAQDICTICNQPIHGTIYLVTDETTGKDQMVCSNCVLLPRCFICGLPVNDSGTELSDGRHLCERDAKTAVVNPREAQQAASSVNDALDRLFARFTTFPTNVDVTVLDRIDVDKMFQPDGNDFESPNLLGCIEAQTNGTQKRYAMQLLTGLPLVELQATAAHEFSHAWVGENVSAERHERIARDAEEGFCEMVAYLLMDSQDQADQKQFILKNHYTRGQVDLFIAAEQQYGFDQVLDWMQNGVSSKLEDGHLEELRDVKTPTSILKSSKPAVPATNSTAMTPPKPVVVSVADHLKLQGIMWGSRPSAIINNQMFFANDRFKLKIDGAEMDVICLQIRKDSVSIENAVSGEKQELHL